MTWRRKTLIWGVPPGSWISEVHIIEVKEPICGLFFYTDLVLRLHNFLTTRRIDRHRPPRGSRWMAKAKRPRRMESGRTIKIDKGQPATFQEIDNPGEWDNFTFRPKFNNTKKQGPDKGKYIHHCLPTGATPVPINDDGIREVGGWTFHYKGWNRVDDDRTIPIYRSGATQDIPFPASRKGSLNGEVLHKLGLSPQRMADDEGLPDALFFHQLILPVHDTKTKTVAGDPRKPFYTEVAKWSNLYAIGELDIMGSGYGHKFNPVLPAEMLQWDGTIVMDGVLGGSNGAILRRFDERGGNNKSYDCHIASAFTKTRWLEVKRVTKLCNNLTAKKRGEDGYDPAYKFDYIYDTIVHNVNALTLNVGLDLCADETSYGFNGWGETGSGILGLILNKPGITRGGQIVMVSDVDRIRPRAYVHRHKLHPKPLGNLRGPNEVYFLWQQVKELMQPNNGFAPKPLLQAMPHFTFDNFFSGDSVIQHAVDEGLGISMTTRRDRTPTGIPAKYLCKVKMPVDPRSKAARFMRPIFCIKKYNENSYAQLTSFQSTSSCNIIHVNAINSCELYASPKERGRGDHKRHWAIEMNESRYLYLHTYFKLDLIYHLIQNCKMSYR